MFRERGIVMPFKSFESKSLHFINREMEEFELVFCVNEDDIVLIDSTRSGKSDSILSEFFSAFSDTGRLSSMLGIEDLSSIVLRASNGVRTDLACCTRAFGMPRYYLAKVEKNGCTVKIRFEELGGHSASEGRRNFLSAAFMKIVQNAPVAVTIKDSSSDSLWLNKIAKEAGFSTLSHEMTPTKESFVESLQFEGETKYFRSFVIDLKDKDSGFASVKYSIDISESEKAKRELRMSRNKIRRLHEVALELSKADTEEEVYDLFVNASCRILEFDVYSLDIVEGEDLVVKRVTNSVPDDGEERYSKYEGVAGRTLWQGKTLVFPDISKSPEARPRSSDYRSALSIPLGSFGVFQTISTELDAFDSEDIELAELLAAHVTEAISRIRSREEITRLTYYDPLTGALSRYGLAEYSAVEIEKSNRFSTPLSLMMLDVDDFKVINDSQGHMYGDFILSWVVESIKMVIRNSDRVIRWGGDEFLIILPGVAIEGAESMGKRILDRLEKRSLEEDVAATVSIGITEYLGEGDNIDGTIYRADLALHAAKNKGKNRLQVYEKKASK
ncbi:MAG TPA: GGDEF domain-containing protein [Mesotoga infera]|uniref:GGDEF domain-containing protein n=1 Tax=Mesotoga infera TaxID=1236046 RepID=A0A7C1CXY5_9BACT|nr:GGDEF domain-containing protein [Mesotoga infera]